MEFKSSTKMFCKLLLSVSLLIALIIVISLIVAQISNYNQKDVLFVSGFITVAIGALSTMTGGSVGLTIQGLGAKNAQYITNATLEATKIEDKNNEYSFRNKINFFTSSFIIIASGVIVVLISLI